MDKRLRSTGRDSVSERILIGCANENQEFLDAVCINQHCETCSRHVSPGKLIGFGDDATVWSLNGSDDLVLRCARSHTLSGLRGLVAHAMLSSDTFKSEYLKAGRKLKISEGTLRVLGYPIIDCKEPVRVHKDDEYRTGAILRRSGASLRAWILETLDEKGIRTILWQIALFTLILGHAFGYVHGDLHAGNVVLDRRLEREYSFMFGGRRFTLPRGAWIVKLVDMDSCRFNLFDGTVVDLRPQASTPDMHYLCTSVAHIRGVETLASLSWITRTRKPSTTPRALLQRLGADLR